MVGCEVGARARGPGLAVNASVPVAATLPGRLVRRYKRFLADVETAGGGILTVHCPDPGRMRGLLREGAAVRCSSSDNPRRKLRHTLEMIRAGRIWVGVNTGRANAVARLAVLGGLIPELAGYTEVRPEVKIEAGSRLDFLLAGHTGGRPDTYLEVKSVTLADGSCARFPDSVTERGRRHAALLERLARDGRSAALLFVVQRADCSRVEPADEIDPAYGEALRRAAAAGVLVLALGARVTPTRIRPERALSVQL